MKYLVIILLLIGALFFNLLGVLLIADIYIIMGVVSLIISFECFFQHVDGVVELLKKDVFEE